MKKTITVVTGGRADWGLLSPVCKAISDNPNFDLRLIATGQHLMTGNSLARIEESGFTVHKTIDMGLSTNDNAKDITKALAKGIDGFADEFANNRPDLLLILGDRYEIFGAVQAAALTKTPITHLCGGDVTEGAFDDAIRHAITKLSHIHFTTNEQASKRLEQLGEDPNHIHTAGNPALDHLSDFKALAKDDFLQELNFTASGKLILVTFHPVTLQHNSIAQCQNMLDALLEVKQSNDISLIITGSNADPEGQTITKHVQDFAGKYDWAFFKESLGTRLYYNALTHCDVMVGNSSSALYEAPSFNLPAINIGDRQKNRLKAKSVIDCKTDKQSIINAINIVLEHKKEQTINPYHQGNAAQMIVDTLTAYGDYTSLIQKQFFDRVQA